jgi:P pilus assembly chaperone PapD
LALVIGLLPAGLGAQVVVDELEVHFRPTADTAQISRVIPVRNELGRAQQVRLQLGDWQRDSLGSNVFAPHGTTPGSCGERIQIFPTTFQVAAGATSFVRVTFSPTATEKGCWAVVFVETVNPPRAVTAEQGSFLTVELRTGVKIYVHAPNATMSGEVESAEMGSFRRRTDARGGSADTVQVRESVVRFANTGTEHLRVKTTLEIRDAEARLIRQVAGKEYYMTPGAVVNMHHVIPTLPAGQYIAIVLLDFGGDEISAAQIDFRIP